jgi:hypothetical protein
MQILLGYVLPLLCLYVLEIVERREYAKGKGLNVATLRACLRFGWPQLQNRVIKNVAVAAACFWTF